MSPIDVWTEAQLSTAKDLWENSDKSASQIAAIIGRTRSAVIGQAHRSGWQIASDKAKPVRRARPWGLDMKKRRPTPPKFKITHQWASLPEMPPIGLGEKLWTEGVAPVRLFDLAPHHCRWPLDGTWYCGGVADGDGPYCNDHHLIAHQAAPPALYPASFVRRFR